MFKTRIILILISIVFALLFFKDQLKNLFKTDFANAGYFYSRYFESAGHWINRNDLPNSGATLIERAEDIEYRFPKGSNDRVYLKIVFGQPFDEISQKYKNLKYIEISDGNDFKKELNHSNLRIGYTNLNLSDSLSGKRNFSIYLKTLSLNSARRGDLTIRGIEVSVIPPEKDFLPSMSLILVAIIIPFVLFCCFRVIGLSVFFSFFCSLASASVFYLTAHFYYDIVSRMHLFIIPAFGILYLIISKIKKVESRHIYVLLFIILLVVAVNLRWSGIEKAAFSIPHPDVRNSAGIGYLDKAEKMNIFSSQDGFYAAKDMHEPFYPLAVKAFLSIIGSSDLHLRFVSFFFSVLAVVLTYLVGRELFKNSAIAIIAMGLIAVNKYLIEHASLGLRADLEICFLLTLFYFCYLKINVLKDWVWILISGVIGGYWLLIKVFNLPVILFIYGHSALSKKNQPLIKRFINFSLASLISAAIYSPYVFNMYKNSGKIYAYSSDYVTHSANVEFAGQLGFPRDKVGLSEYFLKLHTAAQIASYHLIGIFGVSYFLSEEIFNIIQEQNHLMKIFISDKIKGLLNYPVLTLKVAFFLSLLLFSILLCLFNRNFRVVIYVIYLANFASLFLFGVNVIKRVGLLETHRVIFHVLPFVAFAIAFSVYKIYHFCNFLIINRKCY